nr:MAG TPA_asm: hypothetical protein [Caudoviricetes sp.]DAR21186.1 MAG TPA: hypothetical protein [Caudoviricetes sp.]
MVPICLLTFWNLRFKKLMSFLSVPYKNPQSPYLSMQKDKRLPYSCFPLIKL